MILLATKPTRRVDYKEVIYSSARWKLLEESREKATRIMTALESFRLRTLVYGSIARGDVNKNSDIDVFIAEPPSSFLVETALERTQLPVDTRLLVQATPNYAMKAYIEIDAKTSVSFPLMRMRRVEREFYKFGGEININQLKAGVAKRLGVSAETVLDRVHALLKRDEVGRTGVFIKKQLASNETFEMALKKLADKNPAVRRRIK